MSSSEGGGNFSVKFDVGGVRQHLAGVLRDYKGWIGCNPGRASDIESFFKILAYLLPGRVRGSSVIPELLYSTANVISFWHDHILRQEQELKAEQARAERVLNHRHDQRNGSIPGPSHRNNNEDEDIEASRALSRKRQIFRVQVAISILEYFEVFLEVAARKMWGDVGRWVIIFVMQTIKAGLRSALVFYYKIGISRTPAIPHLDRNKYRLSRGSPEESVVFVLKHSGRVIRKLKSAPPLHSRDWNVPDMPMDYSVEQELPMEKIIAEVLHISRPLCHLVSLGACGTSSFKPWLLSLVMDVSSLYLHGDSFKSSRGDQVELQKRTFALLLYLLRSPFYDRATKVRLISSLEAIGSRVPLFGNILLLLAQAIPQWQSMYSYVWS